MKFPLLGNGDRFSAQRFQPLDCVIATEILPALQCNRHISVLHQEVMKMAQRKIFALYEHAIGQETQDLQLAHLVGNRLPGIECKEYSLFQGGFPIHWHGTGQEISGLFNREVAGCQPNVDFNAQRP